MTGDRSEPTAGAADAETGHTPWIVCVVIALASWVATWLIAWSLDPGNETTLWLFPLAGLAVVAGSTARMGAGVLLSALAMTGGTLLAVFDLPQADQLLWLPVQGLLITASLGAQTVGQDLRRAKPSVAGPLFATRLLTTAAAGLGGAFVTVVMISVVGQRTLGAIVIPAGLAIGAIGLMGLRFSLRRAPNQQGGWVPPPPVAVNSPHRFVRPAPTQPISTSPPSPPPPPPMVERPWEG